MSHFVSKETYDLKKLDFSLKQNGEMKQRGNTEMMLYTIDQIISYVSQFFTLKKGDVIFTGTPEGVGPIQVGDVLEAYIEDHKMLQLEIK